jgi:hypothetical protein
MDKTHRRAMYDSGTIINIFMHNIQGEGPGIWAEGKRYVCTLRLGNHLHNAGNSWISHVACKYNQPELHSSALQTQSSNSSENCDNNVGKEKYIYVNTASLEGCSF